jgi:probable HAF family extracellular repeat protein
MNAIRTLALLLICLGLASSLPGQTPYIAHDLGTLGGSPCYAFDINELGQVVGYSYLLDSPASHAFFWENGTMQDLGTLGGTHSDARAINDSGLVAGSAQLESGHGHAFCWSDGSMTDLGTLGGTDSSGFGISPAGVVVGQSWIKDNKEAHAFCGGTDLGTLGGWASAAYGINGAGMLVGGSYLEGNLLWHAVRWAGGMQDLGTLGGSDSSALDINSSGYMVGWSDIVGDGTFHAVLWDGSGIHDLGTLGGIQSCAYAINDSGQIVGWASDANQKPRAFLWENGTMYDLGTLGGERSWAHGINNAGQIVGGAQTADGKTHATLWTRGTLLLYYLCNSGDLEPGIECKFRAIAQEANNADFKAYVLWDHQDPGVQDRVFCMKNNADWLNGYTRNVDYWTATDIGLPEAEMDTGDVDTLTTFIDFVLARQRADRYVLVLFGHGGGVYPTVPWLPDPSTTGLGLYDNGSYLSVEELGDGCAHLALAIGRKFDVLHLDACFMQMIEVNYQVRNACAYIVGSQNQGLSSPAGTVGWETAYLANITEVPSAYDLGEEITYAYYDGFEGWARTVSLVNTQHTDSVAAAADSFARVLVDKMATYRADIQGARNDTQKFAFPDTANTMTQSNYFLDLQDFARSIYRNIRVPEVVAALDAVIDAVDKSVVIEEDASAGAGGWDFSVGTNGISIFFPEAVNPTYSNYMNSSATPADLAFCADTWWDEFVRAYVEWKVLRVASYGVRAVEIQCTTDRTGNGNGTTSFSRLFAPGDHVTLAAAPTVGSARFAVWMRDGLLYSLAPQIDFDVDVDHVFIAVYRVPHTPPPVHERDH